MLYDLALFHSSESVSHSVVCLTLCDPMDCSPPGSSVHGILQGRILEWVAVSFYKGSSQPRDCIQVSHIAGKLFTNWVTRKDLFHCMTVLYFVYLFVIDRHWSITTFCLFWIMVLWTFVHKFYVWLTYNILVSGIKHSYLIFVYFVKWYVHIAKWSS